MARSVGQLLRLLGSESDGEISAAARAICRALARDGRDLHWLGDYVDQALANGNPAKPRQAFDDHWRAAEWLLERCCLRLSENEIDFLETMRSWPFDPTLKQSAWLNKLCLKHGYRQ